jgi:predicted nucleotide-binding protein
MEFVGLIRTTKTGPWLSTDAAAGTSPPDTGPDAPDEPGTADDLISGRLPPPGPPPATPSAKDSRDRRVFITHGKDKSFVEPIKKLLGFGELTPVVSVERQSVAKPVPDKVMDDMRSCGAAIIHVHAEDTLVDKEGNQHTIISGNVLIEIGAAMALYGRRFILLVREGLTLPSNLQGLYEVRYRGDTLDGDATIRLLEAINDIKKHALPTPGDATS